MKLRNMRRVHFPSIDPMRAAVAFLGRVPFGEMPLPFRQDAVDILNQLLEVNWMERTLTGCQLLPTAFMVSVSRPAFSMRKTPNWTF